jgi:hypothetical protein
MVTPAAAATAGRYSDLLLRRRIRRRYQLWAPMFFVSVCFFSVTALLLLLASLELYRRSSPPPSRSSDADVHRAIQLEARRHQKPSAATSQTTTSSA